MRCPRTVVCATVFACVAVAAAGAPSGARRMRESTPARALPPLPSQSATDLAAGRFLVANRDVHSPTFAQTVILLLEHGAGGSLGLIVNRRMQIPLKHVLPDLAALAPRTDHAWFGGPVELGRMLLLIRAEQAPADAERILDGLYASARLDTLEALLGAEGASFRGYLGYAGWAPQQLAGEMARGDWYVAPADAATVFAEHPERVWPELIARSESLQVRPADRAAPRRSQSARRPTRESASAQRGPASLRLAQAERSRNDQGATSSRKRPMRSK